MVEVAADDRWVDASAGDGGDGSAAHPFKSLAAALAPGAKIHLRSGLYLGPWTLPPGVKLVGHGEVVLYAEGEGTVVTADAATLEGLSVQGGFTGVRATGAVTLRRVHFSGHRREALVVTGALTLEDSVLDGSVTETIGVQLQRGARAKLSKVRFTGGFRRAVDGDGAELEADEVHSEGPSQALHLLGGRAVVRTLTVAGGSGPGIFAAEGELTLTDAAVNGHEYGLQALNEKLTVNRFTSRRVQLAGIATVRCTGRLDAVTTELSGSYGGLQLLESELDLQGVTIKAATTTGVLIRLGRARLTDVTVEGVRKDSDGSGGDGLHVRDAVVQVANVRVRDAEGVGLVATAAAQLKVVRLSCERCRVGALVSERASVVAVKGLTCRGGDGPAIAVLDNARVELEDADLTVVEAPIWAECDQGARVSVKRMKSNLSLPPSGCIARE